MDAVDAGVQAFCLATGAVDGLVESALVTALSGLGLNRKGYGRLGKTIIILI
ncbi:hypothetical protein [Capnocytophaga gingivalis]|uniref:hypothetical protein n=1 Tax=Capnocytophaga gingivalis TaxID=1017 RepID=UPI0028D52183|nr:hypothetical protein [Capnocytophaga gingivalis]